MAYIGMTQHEVDCFSITRGLRALAFPRNSEYQKDAEFEFDVSRQTAEAYDLDYEQGLSIPDDVLHRGLIAGADSQGGHLVDEEMQSLIDIFVEDTWAMRAMTVLSGLSGNVTMPGQDERGVAGWTAETGPAKETDPTFRQVKWSPKHVRSWIRVTRQLIVQASFDIEMFIRRDLARGMAKAIDTAVMYGDPTKKEPKGLTKYVGIGHTKVDNAFDGEAQEALIDAVLDAEEWVAEENMMEENCEWLLSNRMKRRMRQVAFFGDYTDEPLLGRTEDAKLLGVYPFACSSQVNAEDAIFADWKDGVMAMWAGLHLMVNPYTDDITGQIRILTDQMVDFNLIRIPSFYWVTSHDAPTT